MNIPSNTGLMWPVVVVSVVVVGLLLGWVHSWYFEVTQLDKEGGDRHES